MIFKYEILNPIVDTKKPFYDKRREVFMFPVDTCYRYYIEAAITNLENGSREYFIILSCIKFDNNCRLCNVDNYGRCQIKLKSEIKDYIISETEARGNIEINNIEHTIDYDVYQII